MIGGNNQLCGFEEVGASGDGDILGDGALSVEVLFGGCRFEFVNFWCLYNGYDAPVAFDSHSVEVGPCSGYDLPRFTN